jgi:hypothetical protein
MHEDTQLEYARGFAESLKDVQACTQVIQDAMLGTPRTNGVGFDERLVDLWKMQKQSYERLDGIRNILWVIALIALIHTARHW